MTNLDIEQFDSLSDLVASINKDNKEEVCIDLKGKTFREQVVIDKPNVTLTNGTIINNLCAYEILEDGYKRGTFRTYTVFVDAANVTFKNVTVVNDSGYEHGQAIALMIDGDDFKAYDCKISSYQDTLFLAPLPEKEYEERGFVGPLKDRERKMRFAYFENCLIEGSVDFIFGGGEGYLRHCEIRSRNIHKEINGYVCAPNTPEDENYGFIFDNCDFTSEEDMKDSVYLARPWRDDAKCFIIDSRIGDHIKAEGYHNWNKPWAEEKSQFKEYNNKGKDPSARVDWMKQVSEKDLKYIDSLREEKR